MMHLYTLLAFYVGTIVNKAKIISAKSSEGTFYSQKSTKVFQDDVLQTFKETPVTACLLSCRTSPQCVQAGMKLSDSQNECVHLRKLTEGNGHGIEIDVELLHDITPGKGLLLNLRVIDAFSI